MAFQGFWGMGNGQMPEVCVPSVAPIIFDDADDGLPTYAPWGFYPPTNATIQWVLPDRAAAGDEQIVGWWGRYTATNTSRGSAFALQQAGTNNYVLVQLYGATDRIRVSSATSGIGTPVIDFGDLTAPDGLDLSAWNFYELGVLWDGSVGSVRLRINGATPTGWADTIGTGNTQASSASSALGTVFWQRNGATWFGISSGVYALDRSGVDLNDFLGVCRFPYIAVDGSGESDFVGSDGNSVDNHLLLDGPPAVPASIADYVESGTATDRQVCTVGSYSGLGLSGGAIIAAQSTAYAWDPLGLGQLLDVGLRSNGVDDATQKTLSSGAGNFSHLALIDPDTGVDWTDGGLDAVETLVEIA